MKSWNEKAASAMHAQDRRKVKRFYDPREKKWYWDITDFWNETFYKDFKTDGEMDAVISLMSKRTK